MSLCEKCLAAPQLFLAFRDGTQIVGRRRLFARRDVLESHQYPALGMARQRQGTGVKNQRPLTLSRKHVIHLNGLEPMTAGKQLFELRTQRGKLKEHCVEGAIARLDSLVSVQHDERIGNRVEDRLGAFAFVDDLIDACAESSHISERQHGAGDLTIACCVGGYPHNEPLLPIAKIGPRFYSACDDLAALLFQTGQAGEHRDIAGRPTNVRWREAKHTRRRFIEADEHKVASQHDDGNIDGIKDVDEIGRSRAPLETGRAVIERNAWRRHVAAAKAVYRSRLRCSTGSATVGRN